MPHIVAVNTYLYRKKRAVFLVQSEIMSTFAPEIV